MSFFIIIKHKIRRNQLKLGSKDRIVVNHYVRGRRTRLVERECELKLGEDIMP